MSLFWCLWAESFFLVGSIKFLTVFDPFILTLHTLLINRSFLPAWRILYCPMHSKGDCPQSVGPGHDSAIKCLSVLGWIIWLLRGLFSYLPSTCLAGLLSWSSEIRVWESPLRAQNNRSGLGGAKHSNLSVICNKRTAQTVSSSVFSTLPKSPSPKLPALLCKALFSVGFIVTMGERQLTFPGPGCHVRLSLYGIRSFIWT